MLGWIGPDNEQLVEVQGDAAGLEILDLHQQGFVYKVPLSVRSDAQQVYVQDYLLLEHRTRHSHYYNRHLPAEGLLVWHIHPTRENNNGEGHKLVDLICADASASGEGRDGLDLWAHDEKDARAGNKGDATDPFDGVRFTDLALEANPAAATTGLAIRQIRRQGDALRLDILQPRWAGTLRGEIFWTGEVIVEGDLTIAREGLLIIYPNTRVRIAGVDRLKSGLDPTRCELRIQGEMRGYSGASYPYQSHYSRCSLRDMETNPAVFEAQVPGEEWYGFRLEGSGQISAPEGSFVLRDMDFALPQAAPAEDKPRPAGFQLLPNFPNPFNSETIIRFSLPAAAVVELAIYNSAGQRVATLVSGLQRARLHTARWDGRDDQGQLLASGLYLCSLRTGQQVETRKLLLVR